MTKNDLVIAHAWLWEDGTQTYADPATDHVDGWCIYRRSVAQGAHGGFEMSDEQDFETREDAIKAGEALAASHGCAFGVED